MTILEKVHKELRAMKEIGMRVPKRAFSSIDEEQANDYDRNGASISEIADLAISLS